MRRLIYWLLAILVLLHLAAFGLRVLILHKLNRSPNSGLYKDLPRTTITGLAPNRFYITIDSVLAGDMDD